MRSRTYDRHVPLSNIYQLRQFIDISLTQDTTKAGYARIIFDGLCKIFSALQRRHCSEFDHLNWFIVEAMPCLAEQRRSSQIDLDGNGDKQEKRRQDNQASRRREKIERALGPSIERSTCLSAARFIT